MPIIDFVVKKNPLSRCSINKRPTGTSHLSTITLTHTQPCQGIPYLFPARDINISQRSEVVGADIGRGLIQGVIWKMELLYLLHSYYFV